MKRKIGDHVWTGTFVQTEEENRVTIRERIITKVIPNYLDKLGLRYGAVTVENPRPDFTLAFRPEDLFDSEKEAREVVNRKVIKAITDLQEILVELPSLSTGNIHRFNR